MLPVISIIVPVYNQASFIHETLNSLSNQTCTDWECILIDDFSTDESAVVAAKWCTVDARFTFYNNPKKGVSNARNFGISKATSKYVLPLDADDLIAPTFLEKIISTFNTNPNLSLVYSNVRFFGSKNHSYQLPEYTYKKLLTQNCFVITSAFKKEDWERVDGFDENLESFEDWDFWIRLLDENSLIFKIEEELFSYRKHAQGSLSNKFSTDVRYYFKLYDYIYDKNRALYDRFFGNPILVFHENLEVNKFNDKIKNNILFKIYNFIKKRL